MYNYAEINGAGICTTVKQLHTVSQDPLLVAIATLDQSLLGKHWTGTAWEAGPVVYRKVLSVTEWVETWTPVEWKGLKTFRNNGTTNGDKLDHLMDAIQMTGSFNLESPRAVQFYNFLVARGLVTQARANELTAGVAI